MNKLIELFYQTSGVCTDTRNITPNCLFICLKGTNFNGNSFAEKALDKGAKFVIVDEIQFQTSEAIFWVENSLIFLQQLAKYHRQKFDIPIIGITGSNGKTSTKELIHAVLSQKFNVLSTSGNLNNHIGVPLTLLRLSQEHEIAVIEMGANRFNDIQELCDIALPTCGIITNIGKAHLEGFINFEGVLRAKKELYTSLAQSRGLVVYNSDDEVLENNIPENVSVLSYGSTENSIVRGVLVGLTPLLEFSWGTADYLSPVIKTNMVGKYNFYNFLAAISFGVYFNVDADKINAAIEAYTPDNNRSQVKETGKNTLILDCYNANPTSMRSALESFSMIPQKAKFFVIGDMLELGKESVSEHEKIARYIEDQQLVGYTVGPIFQQLKSVAFLYQFATVEEAVNYFNQKKCIDSLFLLKGSRGIGLERLESSF
jgi:UDP-N-acetylmuramoyl-tripeptide--D-alanyl-D-alanine ligase